MAYLTLYPGMKKWAGVGRSLETLVNYFFILFGAYVLVAGTYVNLSRISVSLGVLTGVPGIGIDTVYYRFVSSTGGRWSVQLCQQRPVDALLSSCGSISSV